MNRRHLSPVAVLSALLLCSVRGWGQDTDAAGTAAEPVIPDAEAQVPAAIIDVTPVEAAADTAPADSQAGPPAPAGRFETHIEFLDRVELGELDMAADVGDRLISLVEAEEGADSMELAAVLTDVGDVQRRAGRHDAAERNLVRAIDIIQSEEGQTSTNLIKPMTSLGLSYNETENYFPAVGVLTEARSISRRNYGLLNEEQLPLIDHVTESFLGLRQYEEANLQQLQALRLQQRIHGVDTIESLPGAYRYASFLRRMYRHDEARLIYGRAIRVIQNERGKTDPLLAHPLREIGNSFREQPLEEGLGASALKRSIEILEQAEAIDYVSLAQSYRDLGDWYTVFSRVGDGREQYEKAWQLLEQAENGADLQYQWFGRRSAKWVYQAPYSLRGLRRKGSEPGLKDGYVLVQFDLKPDGRTQNVQVLESDPPEKKDDTIARATRKSRLRPILVDGKVALVEGLRLRFAFTYDPDAL